MKYKLAAGLTLALMVAAIPVYAHHAFAAEERAHDDRLEMAPVAGDFDVLGFEALLDVLLDQIGVHWEMLGKRERNDRLVPQLVSGTDEPQGQQ